MKKDKESIKTMFNDIAPRYDFLNFVLSMGIDKHWRRRVVNKVKKDAPSEILDIATGTADLAIALHKKNPDAKIIGGDLSIEMLEIGRAKIEKQMFGSSITLMECDALSLPFEDSKFDVVTCAFGVRNFENLDDGLSQIYRVTRNGGNIYILEFSKPTTSFISTLYLLYFKHILPRIGKIISHNSGAYKYLPDSVLSFPDGEDFVKKLEHAGYKECVAQPVSFGIATIYHGKK